MKKSISSPRLSLHAFMFVCITFHAFAKYKCTDRLLSGGGVHNDAVPSSIETGTPHDKPGLCANKTLVVIFGAICVAVSLAVAVGVAEYVVG